MEYFIIVAAARDWAIGRGGDMPWHQSADLKRFKALTMGHTIIMGRRTFESIGRPLPGRKNVVISSTMEPMEGVTVVKDIESLESVLTESESPAFIIGGGKIYKQMFAKASRIFLTRIESTFEDADTHFPTITGDEWEAVDVEAHSADEKNDYDYSFIEYRRRKL